MARDVNYIRGGRRIGHVGTMSDAPMFRLAGLGGLTDLITGWLVAGTIGTLWFGWFFHSAVYPKYAR